MNIILKSFKMDSYYNRPREYNYKAVFLGMIGIILILLLTSCSVQTFKSIETKQATIESWGMTDFVTTLPDDGKSMYLQVSKKAITCYGDTLYRLNKTFGHMATVKGQTAVMWCSDAIDWYGKKCTVLVCQERYGIKFIQVENEKVITVYQ
jgi:hypothetical protein